MEAHRVPVLIARKRQIARASRPNADQELQQLQVQADVEKAELDRINNRPEEVWSQIDKLKKEVADLESALKHKHEAMAFLEHYLDELPAVRTAQEEKLKSVVRQTIKKTQDLKPIPGSAEEDAAVINAADQIRLEALEALRQYLA